MFTLVCFIQSGQAYRKSALPMSSPAANLNDAIRGTRTALDMTSIRFFLPYSESPKAANFTHCHGQHGQVLYSACLDIGK